MELYLGSEKGGTCTHTYIHTYTRKAHTRSHTFTRKSHTHALGKHLCPRAEVGSHVGRAKVVSTHGVGQACRGLGFSFRVVGVRLRVLSVTEWDFGFLIWKRGSCFESCV